MKVARKETQSRDIAPVSKEAKISSDTVFADATNGLEFHLKGLNLKCHKKYFSRTDAPRT